MKSSEPFNLQAGRARKEAAQDQRKSKRDQQIEDIKWQMSTKQGRRVMWRLMEKAGIFRTSFTGNSETFFREGHRNLGLEFMADINAYCIHEYALMVEENVTSA